MQETETVNRARVIGVRDDEYKLDDESSIIRTDNTPDLRIGDTVEISTDGEAVYWSFLR